MTYSQFVRRLSNRIGMSMVDTKAFLDVLMDEIDTVVMDEEDHLTIKNFGRFYKKERKTYEGFHPVHRKRMIMQGFATLKFSSVINDKDNLGKLRGPSGRKKTKHRKTVIDRAHQPE